VGRLQVLDLMQAEGATELHTLFECTAPIEISSSYFTRAAQDASLVGAQVTAHVSVPGAVVNWNPQVSVCVSLCVRVNMVRV
jgi:hypothetical protein